MLSAYASALIAYDAAIVQGNKEQGDDSEAALKARELHFEFMKRQLDYLKRGGESADAQWKDLCKEGYRLAFDSRGPDRIRARHVISHVIGACETVEPILSAKALNLRGDLNASDRDNQAALNDFCRAAGLLELKSRNAEDGSTLAGVLNNIVDIHQSARGIPRCGSQTDVDMATHALELEQAAIKSNPEDDQFRTFRRNHRIVLARALESTAHPEQAATQIRELLADIRDDAQLARRLAKSVDERLAQLRSSCFNAAVVAQHLSNQTLERDALECFLDLRSGDMSFGGARVGQTRELQLTAMILIKHAKLVAQNRARAKADCSEAIQILAGLVAANPLAPEFAQAEATTKVQCSLMASEDGAR